ncbi:hypothetical protein JCM11641_006795 [Rhodosporidiobolus odoratus]
MAPASYSIFTSSPLDLAPPSPAEQESLNTLPLVPRTLRSRPAQWSAFDLRHKVVSDTQPKGADWAARDTLAALGGRGVLPADTALGLYKRAAEPGLARRSLEPNDTQKVTLGVIGAYAVIITILWNVPVVHWVLWPFKMLTIAFHEFGHAATGCCTGAKIKSISLDPREGGCTMMAGGVGWITLPAGYLGSSLIGALLVFCGFDVVASKVASMVVGVCFLITLWWGRKDWLTIGTILLATGFIAACWFIAHGVALRFYMLFLGVMSGLYSAYDICDDLIFRKVNKSDASVFAERYGGASVCWGVIWVIFSLAMLICGILGGLAAFKDSFSEQAAAGKDFLPTRFMF